MATQVGTVTANNIKVLVSEHFGIVRVYQDTDQILTSNLADLDDLILKLQAAKMLIESVNQKRNK